MNEARSQHSSCTLGKWLFVFGGYDGYKYLESIERCDMEANSQWDSYNVDAFTKRCSAAVSPLNSDSIVIFGGFVDLNSLQDVIILNASSMTAETLV